MRIAPTSLVASERCALRMVGACHHSRDRSPPPPGLPEEEAVVVVGAAAPSGAVGAAVAAGAVVAGADVGCAGAVVADGWVGAAGLQAARSAVAPIPSTPRRNNVLRERVWRISLPP